MACIPDRSRSRERVDRLPVSAVFEGKESIMSPIAKTASANLTAPESNPKLASDPTREPIPRRLYVLMRLEEISTRVREMAEEREIITAELKRPLSAEARNNKQLRQRRLYLAERLSIVRSEQASLSLEKKAIGLASRIEL
jgi:hypothetical protein